MSHRHFLALAAFDMAIHGGDAPYEWGGVGGLNMAQLWAAVNEDLSGYPIQEGTFMPACWYHMAIGYGE